MDNYMATLAALGVMQYPTYHVPFVFLKRHFNETNIEINESLLEMINTTSQSLLSTSNITELMLQVM